MSFAVWDEKPPFEFGPEEREKIYQIGGKWVVTDQGAPTQEQVDAVRNAPIAPRTLSDGDLAAVLVAKRILSAADVQAK